MSTARKGLDRRSFLKLVSAGAAATAMAPALALGGAPASAAPKKNVLFIAVDDLRPQLKCYGVDFVHSPNIDRLAKRGTLFKHAYCQQAVCSPSRSSVLTGCRPDSTKVWDLKTHFRKALPNVVTLPEHFKANGYHTQSFSKIYHPGYDDPQSWSVPAWNPNVGQYQLKENIDALGAGAASITDEDAQVAAAGAKAPRGLPWESADVEDNAYADGMTADKVIEVMRQVKDKTFFLAVGFRKPHLPFVAPKKYWDLYKREDIKLADNPFPPKDMPAVAPSDWGELRNYKSMPKQGPVTDDQARTLIHGYLAATSYMDAQLGKVIDELDRLGLSKNTVIVLWGDHGWKLGEHGLWSKHTNFELDANAPMLMVAPGQKAPGKVAEGLTEFVDMYPTLCDVCGLPQPGHLEGMSFAPLLDKPEREWKKAAFSQYPRRGGMGYSMKTKRYRFTQWFDGKGTLIATELYDHQVDPKENVNVAGAAENAALVTSFAAQLKAGYKAATPA